MHFRALGIEPEFSQLGVVPMPKLHQNGGVTNPRRSIAKTREAVAPAQRLAPALALELLAEDRLPWIRDRSRGWWQHHFHLMTSLGGGVPL